MDELLAGGNHAKGHFLEDNAYWRTISFLSRDTSSDSVAQFVRSMTTSERIQRKRLMVIEHPCQVAPTKIRFGELEVRRMIADRPVLKCLMSDDKTLFDWLSEGFAGGSGCGPIAWDNKDLALWIASHRAPENGQPAKICLAESCVNNAGARVPMTESKAVAAVVFELFNLRRTAYYEWLTSEARAGRLTRNDYATLVAVGEHAAEMDTKAFFLGVAEPWLIRNGIARDVRDWCLDVPMVFELFCLEKCSSEGYPWAVYGIQYDLIRGRPAVQILEELLKQGKKGILKGHP